MLGQQGCGGDDSQGWQLGSPVATSESKGGVRALTGNRCKASCIQHSGRVRVVLDPNCYLFLFQ